MEGSRSGVAPAGAAELVASLRARGVALRAQGDALVVDAPADALTAMDRERIRAEKPAILALLAQEGAAPRPRVSRAGPLPLGLVQQRMWLMHQLDPRSPVHNLAGAWRLRGPLDLSALTKALREVVRRHEVMRAAIVSRSGEPRQMIRPFLEPPLPIVDLSAIDPAERGDEMMRRIRADRDQPFALDQVPLFRARVFRLDEHEHVFSMVVHHVIWDGWSWDVFHDEMSRLYADFAAHRPASLPELTVEYVDFVLWHRELMSGPELARQLGYWRERLAGPLPVLALPADLPRPARFGQRGDRRVLEIDRALLDELWRTGRTEGATLFMVLLAAYAAWLMRFSGQREVTIGVPTQDRLEEGADRLIGVLVNTVVIRAGAVEGMTWRQLLHQVRDACIEAYDNQDVPFERLVDELGVQRTPDRTPLFQTMFTFQDVRNRPRTFGPLEMDQVHVDTGVAPTDVLFGCMVGHESAVAILDFNAELFTSASMTRMASSFDALLHDLARSPDRLVDRLSIGAGAATREEVAGADLFRQPAAAPAVEESAEAAFAPAFAQEGIWFLERSTPGTAMHHLVQAFRCRGALDEAALRTAFRAVAMRHEPLRSRIVEERGTPRVEVQSDATDLLRTADTSGRADALDAAEALLATDAAAPFDLAGGALARALLVRVGPDDHLLQVVLHHVVADEPSFGILYRDLADAYEAARAGRSVERAATDAHRRYTRESRRHVESDEARAQLDYWIERLAEPAQPIELGDRRRPLDSASSAGSLRIALPAETSAALDARAAHDARATHDALMPTLLAAVQVLAARSAGAEKVALGVPLSQRATVDGGADAVGLFLNTVVVACDVDRARTLNEQVDAARDAWQGAGANGDVPFIKVVEQARPHRAPGVPLFQIMVSIDPDAATLALPGVEAEPIFRERPGLDTELAVQIVRDRAGWALRVDYAADVFERHSAERIVRTLANLLARVASGGSERITDVELLAGADRAELLALGTGRSLPLERDCVLDLIKSRVVEHPARAAVSQRGRSLSYGELWARSSAVAAGLHAAGVGAGELVGVCLERSPDLLVALLAIWRAGAAYLPLDPDFPTERLRWMLEDGAVARVITDTRARRALPPGAHQEHTLRELEAGGVGDWRPTQPREHDLAYVLYTSGSTGRPKGVEVEHGALLNLIASMAQEPGLDESDVLLAVTTLSFDIAGLELFLPLAVGGRVEIADSDDTHDPDRLMALLGAENVTAMQATPATWRMLLDGGWRGPLKRVFCGGEAFPVELAGPLLERAHEVWNLFGPTETTIWSTAARVAGAADTSVPIGRPIAETRVFVLDAERRLLPRGAAGELWIAGNGLARGYRGAPELTAERFALLDLDDEGALRAYRTGDLARWRADGQLEHLGRVDDQVKLNGHRIELGEIETSLAKHPGVRRAVVAIKRAPDGAPRLVAYVVWDGTGSMIASELRRHLSATLPDYMVPGLVVEIDGVPLTPNGKIDRGALPNPMDIAKPREHTDPTTETQRGIAAVWRELLGVDRIGVHDNFFELGGHSLLSIRAVALIEERMGRHVDPRSMFFQTLEQVANEADAYGASQGRTAVSA